ncbi:GNAT family N-acetyltransferase [bacterium]|nr:GNAT family N-acetyltransferase [bacterium]
MTEEQKYEVQPLTSNLYKIFQGVYNDFKSKALNDYMFELKPLEYEEFIDSVDKNYMKGVVLLENHIPTAFLLYTSAISEGVELNIIHCLGDEDVVTKRKLLVEKFLELTKKERKDKVVAYPMIGPQADFACDISFFGFKFVGLAVLRFLFNTQTSENILRSMNLNELEDCYTIQKWDDVYFEDVVRIIHSTFKTASDALFDPRYKSMDGTRDILDKIVQNIYGEFLKDASYILLCNKRPCGVCLANLNSAIANIPLVGIEKEHQGKGISKHLVKRTTETVLNWAKSGERKITELNVTSETNNIPALKMYRHTGFKEDYTYPQAYLPVSHFNR